MNNKCNANNIKHKINAEQMQFIYKINANKSKYLITEYCHCFSS